MSPTPEGIQATKAFAMTLTFVLLIALAIAGYLGST